MLPGQYQVGAYIQMADDVIVKVVGQSTIMLLVRPARVWERLWNRLGSS